MHELLRIRDYEDVNYDPFTALKVLGGEEQVQDFYPELKRLRHIGSVQELELRSHFGLGADITTTHLRQIAVLGYKEVKHVLQTPEAFSNSAYAHNLAVAFGESITTMDNPDHTVYRQLFQKAFMPKVVAHWGEEIIPRMINRLIDGFEAQGHAELVNDFTLHFPFHFIHELMGLPMADRDTFHRLAFGQMALTFDPEHGMEAISKLKEYLTDVVLERRKNPRQGDFMSMIAAAEVDGKRLPDNVVISFFRQLMNAGGDTSFNGFSSVLAAFLTHPDQFQMIKRDRSLVSMGIEEGLRWNCPVGHIYRTAVKPTELAGVIINPGDIMTIMLASANRDETAYERPDEFDLRRATRGHAAFGYGPHICIGQHLARLEMINAMNALLDRLPKLRADPDFPPPLISGFSLRGPQKLHVRFD